MKSPKKVIDTENIEALKKLLAQKDRELEIEAALERVRTMTMAMHKTEGLIEVIKTVFKQFELLKVRADVCFINIHQADSNDWNLWVSTGAGQTYQFPVFPYLENLVFRLQFQAREQGDTFYTSLVDKKGKDQFFDHFFKHLTGLDVPKARLEYIYNAKGIAASNTLSRHATIVLANYSCIPYTQEENLILQRIGNVFEQTYTRFLDLQKAEAQAREAQIEAALERLRAASMAMHHSSELSDVASVVFEQVKSLGFEIHQSWIDFVHEQEDFVELYVTDFGGVYNPNQVKLPLSVSPISELFQEWKSGAPFLEYELKGIEVKNWFELLHSLTGDPMFDLKEHPENFYYLEAPNKYGTVSIASLEPINPELKPILTRFAKVFEQTYTRFLDLQKAEDQAREAQIEVALERVRARTMGMHRSDELLDTAQILFQQLQELGIGLHACGFSILDQDSPVGKQYLSLDSNLFPEPIPIRYDVDPYLMKAYEYWKKGKTQLICDIQGEELKNHLARNVEQFKNLGSADILANMAAKFSKGEARQPQRLVVYHAFFRHGILFLTNDSPIDNIEILVRFAKVFEQSYTRFLDLQKAEAQARESEIQLALERVRARTMAMQNSSELAETASVLFQQLFSLGIKPGACAFSILNEQDQTGEVWITSDGSVNSRSYIHPYHTDPAQERIFEAWKSGKTYHLDDLENEELFNHIQFLSKHMPIFDMLDSAGDAQPKRIVLHAIYFLQGFIGLTYDSPQIDHLPTLIRFAMVFEQTYTRFLDLQKAEAQAREAQIEAALERIRSASMAMHKSEELPQVALTFLIQIEELAIPVLGVGLSEINTETNCCVTYFADNTTEGQNRELSISKEFKINEFWLAEETVKYMKSGKKEFTITAEGERLELWIKWIDKIFSKKRAERLWAANLDKVYFHAYQFHDYSNILFSSLTPLPEEYRPVIQRLVTTFRLSYLRFLDLQKAESQAREAEIQLALERVRARTMAMHKSDELVETSSQMFRQLELLGIKLWTFGFNVWVSDRPLTEAWSSSASADIMWKMQVPHDVDPVLIEIYEHRNRNIPIYYKELKGEQLQKHIEYMFGLIGEASDEIAKIEVQIPSEFHFYAAYFKDGYLLFVLDHKIPEAGGLFPRFAKVFEQTYTRFLDLQKAESQAREAQIEAALERIRSASMAMHKSEELPQVALTFLIQIEELAIPVLGVGLSEINTETNTCVTYFADNTTEGQNRELSISKEFEINEFWLAEESIKQMKSGKKEFTLTAEGERLELWIKWIDKIFSKKRAERLRSANLDKVYFHTLQFHEYSSIIFSSLKPLSEEYRPVIQRLVTTFRLSYLRFLDLQKAEAQAREAQIEASMERIRSRSLAMRTSDEIKDVMVEIRRQIDSLGQLDLEASVVHLYEEGNPMFESIAAVRPPGESGDIVLANVFFPVDGIDRIKDMMDNYWSDTKEYTLEFDKEMAEEWQQVMLTYAPMIAERRVGFVENRRISDHSEYWNFADFSEGSLLLVTHSPASADTKTVLRKAAQVFDFAYRRFRDLQKAEARALEAIKQASLDRVRGVISSMRSAGDLDVITPLIFKELMTLGVPFIRCGVFIIQEKQEIVEAYLSSPDGKSLGVLRLPYHASELTFLTVEAWQRGEIYRQHWNKEDFVQWIHQLMEQDQIQDSRTYQGAATPPESLDLHFVPFTQGMLYVGNINPLDEKELELVQSLAKAFSIAFARYEDFVKLEKAKAEVESAMTELKATQSQLVQQEKLASLGQLTAGIAHEIKNPLNFVNNFSEVSIEMIGEIKEERAKSQETRDETLVDEILEDIQSNLGKIHEHGTRANGIVTSMLQHSRGGSGKMEPTDLNALIKEYVNLSFHGMRAGKNPINVDIVLDLDPEIKEVSLIKEDFTRVIINLCNNAFDALKTVKTQRAASLRVRTKKHLDTITIEIEDNGPGIPDEIKDKILQPFFTTKKGTEGTGLGLSITHDIVKAHGGELTLDSNEEVGTQFTIKIPIA